MIGKVRDSAPMSRQDLHRREGARGEIATVEDRLAVVNALLSRRRRLLPWRSLLWSLEQLHQQIDRLENRHGRSDSTRAMREVVVRLEGDLSSLDSVLTEVRAEATGAAEHLVDAVAALRIDLFLADQFRLHAAGLDEAQLDRALNGEHLLETAS